MIKISSQTFIVFDLDDTLYKESFYQDSGIEAVSSLVSKLYGIDTTKLLFSWKKNGVVDLWGRLCQKLNLPLTVKDSFVWQYRLHSPNIKLDDSVVKLLENIRLSVRGIAILTDGRSVTQRLKLVALGLSEYPVYVSEDWDSVKPSKKRFTEIMNKYLAEQYLYIGDNPQKDFKPANDLGWLTIGVRGDELNIHSQSIEDLPQSYQPMLWVNSLEEIGDFLC